MVKLDEYDSQIVLFTKDHFRDEFEEIKGRKEEIFEEFHRTDALKAIWAWRCGINIKWVEYGIILGHLVGLINKLGELHTNNVLRLMDSVIKNPEDNWKLGTSRKDLTTIETFIYSCLAIISGVQVNDTTTVDGELISVPLIFLHEKDASFLEVFDEEENEEENEDVFNDDSWVHDSDMGCRG